MLSGKIYIASEIYSSDITRKSRDRLDTHTYLDRLDVLQNGSMNDGNQ